MAVRSPDSSSSIPSGRPITRSASCQTYRVQTQSARAAPVLRAGWLTRPRRREHGLRVGREQLLDRAEAVGAPPPEPTEELVGARQAADTVPPSLGYVPPAEFEVLRS